MRLSLNCHMAIHATCISIRIHYNFALVGGEAHQTFDQSENGGTVRCSTLISIWGDGFIQAKLEGPYRNRSLFEDIAKQMNRDDEELGCSER